MAAARYMGTLMMLLLLGAWLSSAQAGGRQLSDTKNIGTIASTTASTINNIDGGSKAAAEDGRQLKPENVKEKGVEKMQSVTTHFSDDEAGVVSFNVDYSAPRHHPPKHN